MKEETKEILVYILTGISGVIAVVFGLWFLGWSLFKAIPWYINKVNYEHHLIFVERCRETPSYSEGCKEILNEEL